MIYVPSPRVLRVDARRLSGSLAHAWWWNPRTGTSQRAGLLATTGTFPLTTPSGARDDDWVLVIDGEERGPPGGD
jgi:hypothetical protein